MWNPIDLRKFVRDMPQDIGTIKRHLFWFKDMDGSLVIDGGITGYHCGICDQGKSWDHFHLIPRKSKK